LTFDFEPALSASQLQSRVLSQKSLAAPSSPFVSGYNAPVPTSARSYAKINIGLVIGPCRADGFHELRTVYQTIALHDVIKVDAKGSGTGIEIRCKNPRVPADETNTCYRVAERVTKLLKRRGKITITIEKQLAVQGGLGAGSSNAVATLFALERELKQEIAPEEKLRIAAEVGSDLPLFCIGGAVLGTGRGEEVFPLPDLPGLGVVLVTPSVSVSTPEAFRSWDRDHADSRDDDGPSWRNSGTKRASGKLTAAQSSDRISVFSRSLYHWLSSHFLASAPGGNGAGAAGVPRGKGNKTDRGDRAEALLFDLVRAGIENDFERVVFPQNPELREVKRALQKHGAQYASLSGSGSSLYGLCPSREQAERVAEALQREGMKAEVTATVGRAEYWAGML
jgi:4-diphosphocytidyl-2-C-methyl-D-erythritol kinase